MGFRSPSETPAMVLKSLWSRTGEDCYARLPPPPPFQGLKKEEEEEGVWLKDPLDFRNLKRLPDME